MGTINCFRRAAVAVNNVVKINKSLFSRNE